MAQTQPARPSVAAPPPPVCTAAASTRMALNRLTRGKRDEALKILLYGVEGIGKSTFAALAERPIFLGAEKGTKHLDVVRFEQPQSWDDVRAAVRVLTAEAHEFRTLVIDTLDWIEPLVWDFVCARAGKKSIGDFDYGKGYSAAFDEWRTLIADLERLNEAKGMELILLAHACVKPCKNPTVEQFDRYQLKLHERAAGLFKEWADCVLFANYQTFAKTDERTRAVRGVSTGARMIYTSWNAAFDAKNRCNLPEQLPLDYPDFREACRAYTPERLEALVAACQAKASALGPEAEAWTAKQIEKFRQDGPALARVNNRLNQKLAERGESGGGVA